MAPGASEPEKLHVRSAVSLGKEETVLPDRYVWNDDFRDGAQLSTRLSSADDKVPTIDLSHLSSPAGRKKLAKDIGSAASEWGFFQVINHGVPDDVISTMEAHGKDFFSSLPVEVKERAIETDARKHLYYHGYGGRFQHLTSRVPWLEYLGECYHPVDGAEAMMEKIWPGVGNPALCKAAREYSEALVHLGRKLLELLAESLDLSTDFFSQHFSDSTRYQAHWRFNQYPACPEPAKALGLGPHTDPCGITIVMQDDVGGFQLRKNGQWFDVEPMAGSFLVNIGDCLQAWSNGRFSSVLHRALVNDHAERLSIVFPFSPAKDFEVSVPASLVDEEHPLQYPSPIEWHHLAVIKGSHVAQELLSPNFGLKSS